MSCFCVLPLLLPLSRCTSSLLILITSISSHEHPSIRCQTFTALSWAQGIISAWIIISRMLPSWCLLHVVYLSICWWDMSHAEWRTEFCMASCVALPSTACHPAWATRHTCRSVRFSISILGAGYLVFFLCGFTVFFHLAHRILTPNQRLQGGLHLSLSSKQYMHCFSHDNNNITALACQVVCVVQYHFETKKIFECCFCMPRVVEVRPRFPFDLH